MEPTASPTPKNSSDSALSPDQQAAVAMSNATAEDTETKLRNETIVAGVVGNEMGGGIYSQYAEKFYNNLGTSWWEIAGIGFGLYLLLSFAKAPGWTFDLLYVVIGVYVMWLFVSRFVIKRK